MMNKIVPLVLAIFLIASCDLFYNNESDYYSSNDITIAEVRLPPTATKGESVEVSIVVQNLGAQDITENLIVMLVDETEGDTIATQSVEGGLAADTLTTLTYLWDTGESTVGEHTLSATHNLEDDDIENNKRSVKVMVNEPESLDIALSTVDAPGSVARGELVTVEATIENRGTQDVGEAITVTLMNQTKERTIGTQTIEEGLGSGDSRVLSFNWDTNDERTGNHTLLVSHSLTDDNAENNTVSKDIIINEAAAWDLAISEVTAPSSATKGEDVMISVVVQNTGNQDISADVTLILNDNETRIGSNVMAGGMEAGKSSKVGFIWNTDDVSPGVHTISASHNYDDDNADNNLKSTTITINEPQVVDIAISAVDAPSSTVQGENVSISVTVRNVGNSNTDKNIEVTLVDQTDSKNIDKQTINGLNSGADEVLTFIWDTEKSRIGLHTIRANHNFDDNNSDNDSETTTIRVDEPKKVDIAITEFSVPSGAKQGETVEATVTVQNVGNLDLNNSFTVTLTDQTDGIAIGSKSVNELDQGESVALTFSWNTEKASVGSHSLVASHNFSDETPDDNTRSATITIDEPDITDIAITAVNAPSSANRGFAVEVEVTIGNIGNKDVSEAISVTLVNKTSGDFIGGQILNEGLDKDDSITLKFTWQTYDSRTGDHTLVASHDFEDVDPDNNSKSTVVTLKGLLDDDDDDD